MDLRVCAGNRRVTPLFLQGDRLKNILEAFKRFDQSKIQVKYCMS